MPCANDTEKEAVVSLLSSSGDRWLEVRERERERERGPCPGAQLIIHTHTPRRELA